ncbi:MAG TPA: helix-turn-helix transcriptional regulator [Clostridia bacterium]|nr:helix-turn-helix transcriptional regulator [Clostridia bacterium]
MRRLSSHETQAALERIGIDKARAPAFAYDDPAKQVRYEFHTHSKHQLLYSFSGTIYLETKAGFWMLPPQRAAWIPCGVRHATTLKNVRAHSLYFAPRQFPSLSPDIQIVSVTPLLREMILYAMQWQVNATGVDRFSRQYFAVLSQLLRKHADYEAAFQLPRPKSVPMAQAVDYFLEDVGQAALTVAARRANCSVRTFRRKFQDELGLTWKDFVHNGRMFKAMELLTTGMNVTEVSLAVGFNSLSAFSKAFRRFTRENPQDFRNRSVSPSK